MAREENGRTVDFLYEWVQEPKKLDALTTKRLLFRTKIAFWFRKKERSEFPDPLFFDFIGLNHLYRIELGLASIFWPCPACVADGVAVHGHLNF